MVYVRCWSARLPPNGRNRDHRSTPGLVGPGCSWVWTWAGSCWQGASGGAGIPAAWFDVGSFGAGRAVDRELWTAKTRGCVDLDVRWNMKARGYAGLDVHWNIKTRGRSGLDGRWSVNTPGLADSDAHWNLKTRFCRLGRACEVWWIRAYVEF